MGAGPSSTEMGAGSSSSAELAAFSGGGDAPFDAVGFQSALAAWCEPYRLECSPPFLVGWYNEQRKATADGQQLIEAPEDAVAFALLVTWRSSRITSGGRGQPPTSWTKPRMRFWIGCVQTWAQT
mmetsp:Transcript_30932/g.103098  ORF Transcript_30932/g.103098 Transcript_30932/m.103098 type:complete len:125 (+) Transcript_30932:64-438(+)